MKKYYLMAPGPSMIPEAVLLEMAKPIIHHRTKLFEKVIEKVRGQLKQVFQTKNEVIIWASAGSGGMEAAIVNCFSPGDKVVCIKSGKFGERWSEQAKRFGLEVIDLDVPWGKAADIDQVKDLLTKHKDIKGVLTQACETSTGVMHPIEELGKLVVQHADTLFLVDAITALGVTDIPTDAWHIDVCLTGSQKALMLPPGLAFMSMSAKALKAAEKSKLPKFYFDALAELKCLAKNQTNFTPAISLIQGLSVSLETILTEGLPKVFARHSKLAKATREGVKAMGLELFAENPADSITAVKAPAGIDGEKIVQTLYEKHGVQIIGGQDQFKGKVFRLGHMGYCGDFDVLTMIGALEMSLADLGHKAPIGQGVAAALRALHERI